VLCQCRTTAKRPWHGCHTTLVRLPHGFLVTNKVRLRSQIRYRIDTDHKNSVKTDGKKIIKQGTSTCAIYITQKPGNVAPPKWAESEQGCGLPILRSPDFEGKIIDGNPSRKTVFLYRHLRVFFGPFICRHISSKKTKIRPLKLSFHGK